MRQRILRAVTYLVIFFFTWTMGGMFNVAFAAYNEIQKPSSNKKQEQRPEEKFQKVMDDLKGIVSGRSSWETRKGKLKEKRDAIESLDKEIKSQFADTENKLKNAGLPQEILQRHYNFVKHYEDNLKELRAKLDAAENSKTDKEFENNSNKIRQHLGKTSPPKKHKPLDPNKLPHRISDSKRKEPRTKPEEFQKDIKKTAKLPRPLWEGIEGRGISNVVTPAEAGVQTTSVIPVPHTRDFTPALSPANAGGIQKTKNNNQPLLLASNGPLTGLVDKLPKYEESQNLPHPLFTKEGSNQESNFNSFNSPPFLKGDTGGFSINANEPITLALAHDAPTTANLAETIDVQLTPAIRAKAAELNYSPVKIYNWVRNNVEYVPTYGSIQGADMCLQTLQGNDFDIASLLIALLRASGIHARYVYGTVELPIDKVMNWVGGFTNANAALSFIASGGTPVAGFISGGKISAVRMEHVWVEAYVKYYPLRGAKHETGQGDSWIPLDASFKQYTYTQGVDIKTAVPFDAQTFVNQIQSTATIDTANSSVTNINSTYIQQQMQSYQTQVKNYIEQNYPNATAGDILGKKEIIKQNFSFLLGTLPYQKAMVGVRYSEIPDSLRHKIKLELISADSYGEIDITYVASLPQLAGKRFTLSYDPATASDQDTINKYAEQYATSIPAYLIQLKPVLKIENSVVSSGSTLGMGTAQYLNISIISPHDTEKTTHDIFAGDYAAVGLNPSNISLQTLQDRINTNDYSEAVGEMLHQTALSYWAEVDAFNSSIAKTLQVHALRHPSELLVKSRITIEYSWGIPYLATYESRNIDVRLSVMSAISSSGEKAKSILYMKQSDTMSSFLEGAIFDQLFGKDIGTGVSAVSVLQTANAQGIPIYTIDSSNVTAIMPLLQISNETKAEIANAVNAGLSVQVSKTNVNHNGWIGCGYIITNPNTGAGAYMISGGLSGGDDDTGGNVVIPLPQVPITGVPVFMIGMLAGGADTAVKVGASEIAIGVGTTAAQITAAIILAVIIFGIVQTLIKKIPPLYETFRHYTSTANKASILAPNGFIKPSMSGGDLFFPGVYLTDLEIETDTEANRQYIFRILKLDDYSKTETYVVVKIDRLRVGIFNLPFVAPHQYLYPFSPMYEIPNRIEFVR